MVNLQNNDYPFYNDTDHTAYIYKYDRRIWPTTFNTNITDSSVSFQLYMYTGTDDAATMKLKQYYSIPSNIRAYNPSYPILMLPKPRHWSMGTSYTKLDIMKNFLIYAEVLSPVAFEFGPLSGGGIINGALYYCQDPLDREATCNIRVAVPDAVYNDYKTLNPTWSHLIIRHSELPQEYQ
jgi:hypothetical protein